MSNPPADRPTDAPARLLSEGESLPLELAASAAPAFEIEAAAGDLVRATAEQHGGDAELRLFAPDGELLMRMDSPTGAQGDETVSAVAAASGRYRLEVHPAGAKGAVTLRVEPPRPASDEDRRHVEAEHAFAAGDAARRAEDFAAARASYRRARELFAASPDRHYETLALYRSGWMGVELKDAAAGGELEQAEEGFAQLGDDLLRTRVLARLGDHYIVQAEYDTAVSVLVQARIVARDHGDLLIRAGIAAHLGQAQRRLRHYQEAQDANLEALALWQQAGALQPEANQWLSLAEIYVAASALDEAQRCLDHAAEMLAEQDLPESEAVLYRVQGNLYERRGDYDAAVSALERSLQLRRQQRFRLEVTLMDLGLAHLERADRDAADLDRADALLEEAVSLYRQASDRAGEAMVLIKLGRIDIEQQDWDGAQANLDRAEEALRGVDDPQAVVSVHYNQALALHRRGEYRRAHEILKPLQAEAEALRDLPAGVELRAAFVDARYHYGELYVDNLMRLDETEPGSGWETEALAAAQRWRARGLLDLLDQAEVTAPSDSGARRREQELLVEIDDLERRRGSLLTRGAGKDEIRALDRTLADRARELRSVSAQVRQERITAAVAPLVDLGDATGLVSDLQTQLLPARTVVLVYALGDEHSYLWAMTRKKVVSRPLPSRGEVERLVDPLLSLLRSPRKDVAAQRAEAAAKLSSAVLAPAWDALRELDVDPGEPEQLGRLVVVPDGALLYVPFSALPVPGADDPAPLIRRYEVAYLPSLSTGLALRRRDRRPRAVGVLAALADPVFEADDPRLPGAARRSAEPPASRAPSASFPRGLSIHLFPRLPATAVEVRSISEGLPADRTRLALGFDARRELVLSGGLDDYRILHFATHGIFDRNHPELSGLVLSRYDAKGRPVSGYLRLAEIHRLRLRADLAVLSACETGLGREYRGEGLLGLAHGFFEAGVPRLVVSMWRVDDEDTAKLMELFYANLFAATGYRSVPDALRQAQISMLDDDAWSSPHQWAGFIYLGDAVSVQLDDPIEGAETGGAGGTPDEPPDEPTPGGGPGRRTGPPFWNPDLHMPAEGGR